MTEASSTPEQRVLELLADRAVFGLEPAEERELEALLATHPSRDPDALDRLAAAVAAIATNAAAPSLPHSLKARIGEDARRFSRRRGDPAVEPAGRRSGGAASLPRMLAAGLLCALATIACVAVIGRSDPRGAEARRMKRPAPTSAMQRDDMLASAGDALRLDCAAAAADGAKTSGDVVWSGSRQRGFLRISGLAPNEPTESQYQIWIVEGGHGRPVPGGVFDVGREAGEVIVPILPQAFVQGPTTFVVTVEKPGGAEDYSEERSRVMARAR
jgi:anti-sigma-K factor RskA